MSLINDALRRANQQKKEQPPEVSDGTPMQPVHQPQRANASRLGPMVLIFSLGVVLTCAAWFFWKGSSPTPVRQEANRSATAVPNQPDSHSPKATAISPLPAAAAAPVARTETPSLPAPVIQNSSTETTTAAPVEVAPPQPPPPPVIKLQGIFYRISKPTALINGKTVEVGDKVEGARVMKIDRKEVTIQRDGQNQVLALP